MEISPIIPANERTNLFLPQIIVTPQPILVPPLYVKIYRTCFRRSKCLNLLQTLIQRESGEDEIPILLVFYNVDWPHVMCFKH